MTEDDVTKEDFENFDEKTQDEKMETLRSLHQKLADGEDVQGLLQQLDVEGELTVRVLDEEGEEKHVQKQEFEA
jgi:hypothetical protein